MRVESYYDRHLRVWTIMIVRDDGGIVGDIQYAHTREHLAQVREELEQSLQGGKQDEGYRISESVN